MDSEINKMRQQKITTVMLVSGSQATEFLLTRFPKNLMSRPANGPLTSKRLGASQVALSCDPIVFFEGAPDLVLKFTIFRGGQSFCDLVRSRYRVELRSHRSFGLKVHQLANLEFVVAHAGIEPPDGHARRAAR